jgi:hypothetical protein
MPVTRSMIEKLFFPAGICLKSSMWMGYFFGTTCSAEAHVHILLFRSKYSAFIVLKRHDVRHRERPFRRQPSCHTNRVLHFPVDFHGSTQIEVLGQQLMLLWHSADC